MSAGSGGKRGQAAGATAGAGRVAASSSKGLEARPPTSEDEAFRRYRQALIRRFSVVGADSTSGRGPSSAKTYEEEARRLGDGARTRQSSGVAPQSQEVKGAFGLPDPPDQIPRGELEVLRQSLTREHQEKLERQRAEFERQLAEFERQRAEFERQLADLKKALEDQRETERARLRRERVDRWQLSGLVDAHLAPLGLLDELEAILARIDGLAGLAAPAEPLEVAASRSPADVLLARERDRALRGIAWVLSAEFYLLLARIRAERERRNTDVRLTSAEFNDHGIALAGAMNARIFGGTTSVETVMEGARPDDALHDFSADVGNSDSMRPATFLVRDASGAVLHRAQLVRRSGGAR